MTRSKQVSPEASTTKARDNELAELLRAVFHVDTPDSAVRSALCAVLSLVPDPPEKESSVYLSTTINLTAYCAGQTSALRAARAEARRVILGRR